MKQISYVLALVFLATLGAISPNMAQETTNYVNHNSTSGIPDYDIMYKKRLWRRMDLKEKQNRSFFAFNNEITKIIIEGVNAGVLFPYKNDSLLTRMSREEFLENMKMPVYGGRASAFPPAPPAMVSSIAAAKSRWSAAAIPRSRKPCS